MDDEKEVFSKDLREIYGGRPAHGYVIMIMITTLVLLYVYTTLPIQDEAPFVLVSLVLLIVLFIF
jgi:hypothetical protein